MIYRTFLITLLSILTHIPAESQYNKVLVKEIFVEYDQDGYPMPSSLKKAIIEQYFDESDEDKISVQQVFGGYYTERMYVVKLQKERNEIPVFYLKISRNAHSTQRLIDIKEGWIYQDMAREIESDNLAIIVWIENVFTYTDPKGTIKTIEVTYAVSESSLKEILYSENERVIEDSAYAVGKAVAAFHLLFMDYKNNDLDARSWVTVCHGDFNIKNIHFSSTTKKVYLIDNEDMNKGCIEQDLKQILMNFTILQYLRYNYPARWPLYITHCSSFLRGYVESYPEEKRGPVAALILSILTARVEAFVHEKIYTPLDMTGNEFNEEQFAAIIYKYLNNIF